MAGDFLAFADFVELSEKGRDSGGVKAVEAPDGLTLAIEENQSGETLDLVPFGEFLILFSRLDVLWFLPRKIDFDQYEILGGVILELRLRENKPIELNTIAAPIRAGEVQKDKFIGGFCLFLRFFVVGTPGRIGAR